MMLRLTQLIEQPSAYQEGYQQALDDFRLNELLLQLQAFSESVNVEFIASLLIQQLSNNINDEMINSCLNALALNEDELVRNSFHQINTELPANFATDCTPRYRDGSHVRWKPLTQTNPTDWGIVIGHFYSYSLHLHRWEWKYVVKLDANSTSSSWVKADTAWQEDLEVIL